MEAPFTCRRCGTALDDRACPRCLLELGLAAAPPVAEEPASAPAVRFVPPSIEELAPHFPELEIESLIGQGGMGAVFRAKQKRLARDVALKVLPRELSSNRAFAERFLREARALALLNHPNIVAVHDYGETGGVCWLLLEYVDGANLRSVLKAGELESRTALALVRDLCDALQYAHDEGVVHRDIKPENVLVDRRGRAKVADFGLAKLVGSAQDAHLTREGQVMGTPHYMAPEQIERPREVDHRADIYALGVVLYEMLTGSLPRGNFEPPSRRVQVDVKLDEIVLKALEHEPSRRYQHAVDVRTDVDAVGDGARSTGVPFEASGARAENRAQLGGSVARVELREATRSRRGAAAESADHVFRDPFRGGRGFALVLASWIALGASWNLGPFVFGLASVVVLALGGLLVRGKLLERAELAAALAAEGPRRKATRLFGAAVTGVLGLGVVTLGHVAHWEHGVRSWVPAWIGTDGYVASLRANVWSLMPAHLAVDEIVQPRLALTSSATAVRLGEGLPVPGLALILVGLVVLGLAIYAAVRVEQTEATRSGARTLASVLGSQIALGLVVLWIGAPIAALRPATKLDTVSRESHLDVPIDEALAALRSAFTRAGLHVDVAQVAQVVDERTGVKYADLRVLRGASESPFERWTTTMSGAVRRTSQVWVSMVRKSGGASTEVRMNAGLYPPESPEARAAAELLGSLETWMSGVQ